ncbi:hypothetical protein PLA106_26499, partial [Pseudomonas amygdali pv. lachrymans str. M302278]
YLFCSDIKHRFSAGPDLATANHPKAAPWSRAALQSTPSILVAVGQPSRFPPDLTLHVAGLIVGYHLFFVVRFSPDCR